MGLIYETSERNVEELQARIDKALHYAMFNAGHDGDHHKMWTIDQMVRSLTGCPMETMVAKDCRGEEYSFAGQGKSEQYSLFVEHFEHPPETPDVYEWDEGIPP